MTRAAGILLIFGASFLFNGADDLDGGGYIPITSESESDDGDMQAKSDDSEDEDEEDLDREAEPGDDLFTD